MAGDWTPEPFEADDGTVPFQRFVEDLSDFKFVALDAAIERVLSRRGIDLVRTEWLKALGEGLHEFRVRHDAEEIARMFGGDAAQVGGRSEKVLLRVFVHFHGQKVVLLLGGYDKGDDPKERRQQRDRRGATAVATVQGASASPARPERSRRRLTSHGEFSILDRRRFSMARTYQEVTAARRERLAPDADADREVFEHAYGIAMQVVELREHHGLTQSELAQRCGMDQGDISRIERGATSPTARTLQRIAEALDADVRLVARAS